MRQITDKKGSRKRCSFLSNRRARFARGQIIQSEVLFFCLIWGEVMTSRDGRKSQRERKSVLPKATS